jgi:hypothetical protein
MFAKRKTSDIQRLANQYQSQSTGLAGEYETAFAGYQKNVAEQMLPYEEQMKQYREVASPEYEAATERYNQEFENYKGALSAWEEKPYTTEIKKSASGGRYLREIPIPMPTFNKKAPSAPTAPTAPKVEAFNEEPFARRREELQTTYQRELAERKSARLGAARRGSTRPMLQGE